MTEEEISIKLDELINYIINNKTEIISMIKRKCNENNIIADADKLFKIYITGWKKFNEDQYIKGIN